MNVDQMSRVLLEGLQELEREGDLVITCTAPQKLAEALSSRIVQQWAKESVEILPHEVVIADTIKSGAEYLNRAFSLPHPEALAVVERFVEDRRSERTLSELADLVAHQGHQDIAMAAYYCIQLRMGRYYDQGYLAWRSKQIANRR